MHHVALSQAVAFEREASPCGLTRRKVRIVNVRPRIKEMATKARTMPQVMMPVFILAVLLVPVSIDSLSNY